MSNGPKLGMQMLPCLTMVLRPILTPKLRRTAAERPPLPREPWLSEKPDNSTITTHDDERT